MQNMDNPGRWRPRPWHLPAALGVLGLLVVAGAARLIFRPPPHAPQWERVPIRRPSFTAAVVLPPLDKLVTSEEKQLLLREGYGLIAVCTVLQDGHDAILQSTTLMPFDANPALENRLDVFKHAAKQFADAVSTCNKVRIEHTFVFVDRTRPNIDAAIREQARRSLVESSLIAEVLDRRNGLHVTLDSLSADVYQHDQRSVEIAPPLETQKPASLLEAARDKVDTALAAWLARPMGEPSSAIATTLAYVLTTGKPAEGDLVIVYSDYFENDPNTIRVTRSLLPESGDFRSPKVRDEIKGRLSRILPFPLLAKVRVELHLLPVASELPRMKAMAKIFEELLEEKGAIVTVHLD